MKLSTKLTLFVTVSKLAIVALFVLALPFLVDQIAFKYTNDTLRQQQKRVLNVLAKDGVNSYLDGQESYGGYNLLKEEFIAISPVDLQIDLDTIETSQRIVEKDTLDYRVLSYTFVENNQNYLLEIGKATSTMGQYSRPLQRFALFVLLTLIFITLIIDLFFTHQLIKPLGEIIKSKLKNQRFPFAKNQQPIATTTEDFKYLDKSLMELMEQINEDFEKEREFTANASHELMTPISILQNKIENLMEHQEVTDAVQQRLSEMLRTLSRLKKIVNSLLLISRIENEQFAKTEKVNIKLLLEEVMEEISHRLEEREIKFEMSLEHEVSISSANHDLLFQLFYNLVNNAIRYNKEEGSIAITDSYRNGEYSIFIKDTGMGIPKDEIPLIFNRFKKANFSQTGGYGLGLSIVKSIANFHQIRMEVESEVDKGSLFSVVFTRL